MDRDEASDMQNKLATLGPELSSGFQEDLYIDRGEHIPGQGFCDCWKSFVWGSKCSPHNS